MWHKGTDLAIVARRHFSCVSPVMFAMVEGAMVAAALAAVQRRAPFYRRQIIART
jgi:hypothetical protein